jgi:hypothetical protein
LNLKQPYHELFLSGADFGCNDANKVILFISKLPTY